MRIQLFSLSGLWCGLQKFLWPFSIFLRSLMPKKCSGMQNSCFWKGFHHKKLTNQKSHSTSLWNWGHTTLAIWICNTVFLANFLSQSPHWKGLFPSWTWETCPFKTDFKANCLSHLSHLNGFSPSWTAAMCLFNSHLPLNSLLQCSHFLSSWALKICSLRELSCGNSFWQ